MAIESFLFPGPVAGVSGIIIVPFVANKTALLYFKKDFYSRRGQSK